MSLRDCRLWLPLLIILLLAAAIRFFPLPHEALSGDEVFSRRMVVESSARGWEDIRQDLVHPPLYYVLLKEATALWGASALGLRLLSLLCGLLTLPVLVLLGNKLPGARWTGLLAAACVAVGRYTLFYSQEARSYAMYTLVTLLLVLWLAYLGKWEHGLGFWAAGCSLMTALVYTHYVGGLFVAMLIFAVLISSAHSRDKVRTLLCGCGALLLFCPWLLGEVGVYRAKHGIGENLDWQGHPGFYDLRQVWAAAAGVNTFPGATLLALFLLAGLTAAALWLLWRRGSLRATPVVLALVCMGWLTPLIVFVLSEPPVNLPMFALRHLLPAIVLLSLLAAYGLELLAKQTTAPSAVLAAGAVCVLLMTSVPTLQVLRAGTFRYPYDRIGRLVTMREQGRTPAYAVSFYGVGEPVNFYCERICVQKMPTTDQALPAHLLLLYRPVSSNESGTYKRLLHEGYVDQGHMYFTDGSRTEYGTTVASLERPGR